MKREDTKSNLKVGDIVYCIKIDSKCEFNEDGFLVVKLPNHSLFNFNYVKLLSLKDYCLVDINAEYLYKNKIDILKKELEEYKEYRKTEIEKMDAHVKELENKINKELNK